MFSNHYITTILAGSLAFLAMPSIASEKISGVFTTEKRCNAHHSIRKQSNPVALIKGQSYAVKAKNKPSPSHYLIEIPSQTMPSWVAVDCGVLTGGTVSTKALTTSKDKAYLLALSWQPGFCSTHKSKKECKRADHRSPSATHLSLHGLWPQPRNNAYCGVSEADKTIDRRGRWNLLAPLALTSKTAKALKLVMPGYASLLQRHEWVKHGTCYSRDAETYYKDSIRLTNAFNEMAVDELLMAHKGKKLTLTAIRSVIAKQYGRKAASHVALRCGRQNQITELWVGLKGDAKHDSLNTLMRSGEVPSSNCQSGLVSSY